MNERVQGSPLVMKLREHVISVALESSHVENWFLDGHLKEVEKKSCMLCDLYPGADREIVMLATWFHDFARLLGVDKNHHFEGARFARTWLESEGYPENKIEKVAHACEAHGCDVIIPESLEAEIVATADAMSHFENGFFFRLIGYLGEDMPLEDKLVLIRRKMERDYKDKMLLPEAREIMAEKYHAWCLILDDVLEKQN